MNYRIGTTSYIFPGTMIENVRYLKDKIDDIELLYFEKGYFVGEQVVRELKTISNDNELTFSIHLPLDLDLNGYSRKVIDDSLKAVRSIVSEIGVLEPSAYILHINNEKAEKFPESLTKTLNDLQEIIPSPERLCIENLNYSLELLDFVLEDLQIPLCLDMGHLISHGFDYKKAFEKYIDRTRVIHLYGTDRDHRHHSLNRIDKKILDWFKGFLDENKYEGIVTLEVFTEQDLKESLELLEANKKGGVLKNVGLICRGNGDGISPTALQR